MRLWRIFGDAAETDMRCGSDGGREKGKNFLPLLQHVFLSSPSAHRTGRAENRKDQCQYSEVQTYVMELTGCKKPTRRSTNPAIF